MKHILVAAAVMVALAGCARPNVWVKTGASAQDFSVDEYNCEKDTRQSGYFGTGFIGAQNMQNFFDRCMVVHGWHLQQASGPVGASYSGPAAESSDRLVTCRIDGKQTFVLRGYCNSHGGAVL
jgi:hypothetical protein